ncbi:MAG TPA: peptide MFS transporter [Thermoanaerobaculia bacterium]
MSSSAPAAGKQWFGQPRGLSTLFFTEMWERFSYYGMRGLLILFLVASVRSGGFGMTDEVAAAIYGLYVCCVYLFALPGGWVADRILGQQNAVFVGGCIIAAGHFSMAIPSVPTFYLGLCLIVVGTGLLKPNVSAIVGDLYPEGGVRRDAGFSIFYAGINTGAFAGPIVCGFLGEHINWHLGFGAAGIGMILGVIQYRFGAKYLPRTSAQRAAGGDGGARRRAVRHLALAGAGAAAVGVTLAVLQRAGVLHLTLPGVARSTGVIILGLVVLYLLYLLLFGGLDRTEKKRVAAVFVFFAATALFWSGFEQAGSSMNLFASQLTNRLIGGWEFPASWFLTVNALLVIVFSPLSGILWLRLGSRQPSLPAKLGYGLAAMAIGFLVMAWGALNTHGGANRVGPGWLVSFYVFSSIGEVCVSPVGLSAVTKLAPKRLLGQMMGVLFMGNALGNLVAGLVAGGFASMPLPGLFGSVAKVIGAGALVVLIFSKPIRSLIGELPSGVRGAGELPAEGSVAATD